MKPILPSINDIDFKQLNTNDMPGPELMEAFIRDFAKVQWYEQNSIRFSSPEESHQYMVMGLILNGAKAEGEYCKALLRYLFKTYYKSLYKQLKRFNKISADEIISLSEIDERMDLD